MNTGRTRKYVLGAVALVVCAAAGAGIWWAVDGPVRAGAGTSGASAGGEPGGTAGSTTAVPIEPGIGDGSGGGTGPGETTGLDLRGTVTRVGVIDVTTPEQLVVGSILVEGPQTTDARYDKAAVTITKDTRIFGVVDGHVAEIHPDIAELQDKRVEVGFTGPVAESYPVQATAAWITVLD